MKKSETLIKDLFVIKGFTATDQRGMFKKIFQSELLSRKFHKINEVFYSISHKNVLRGMHFQLPPFDNYKLVHVLNGSILDVTIDLRKKSPSFLKKLEVIMESGYDSILIPPGVGHGFKSLEDNTIVLYLSSAEFRHANDGGILYSSISHDWKSRDFIVSDKDFNLPSLEDFLRSNPF